jgi:hypothetical protein
MKSINILRTHFFVGLLFFLSQGSTLIAQPMITVLPKEVHFESRFQRYQRLTFLNRGNAVLTIDSIKYGYDRYFFRFNKNSDYTIQIAPHDSLSMDCYLLPFIQVLSNDVDDTLLIYSNSSPALFRVKIHVDYFEQELARGSIRGQVSPMPPPPGRGSVYFFYNGKYLVDSAQVNQMGNFSRDLPDGDYVVGVLTDSSYLTFYPRTTNIFNAQTITVTRNSIINLNLTPIRFSNSSTSINGTVIDSIANLPVKKGVVVIKSGIHTPGVASKISAADTIDTFTFFVTPRGDYFANRLPHTGYYYAQAVSDYFLPSYFNKNQTPALFWQQADSVNAITDQTTANIYVTRDSAYGAGVLSGTISNYNKSTIGGVSGAILYARSTVNNKIYLAGNSSSTGDFTLYDLPYGTYSLLVQRFGYVDLFSPTFTIDSANPQRKNIQIMYPMSVETNDVATKSYIVLSNYPNPFNPTTTIAYTLPYESDVEISVYSAIGQKITDLVRTHQASGSYKVTFSAANQASGIYFIKLKTQHEQKIIKAIAIK